MECRRNLAPQQTAALILVLVSARLSARPPLLSLAMTLDLHWAPLEFGTLWAIALVVIGIRVCRLGCAEQPSERVPSISRES